MVWCHYVPQMYMNSFGINNKQTIRLDKRTGLTATVSIESFCAQNDFFCFDDNDLKNLPSRLYQFAAPSCVKVPQKLKKINKTWIEDALAYYIEGPVTAVLKTIRTEKNLKNVTETDFKNFLAWICWLFVANPNSLAIEAISNTIKVDDRTNMQHISKAERLEFYFDLHDRLLSYFVERKWLLQLINFADGPLLTNDRPVMLGGASLNEKPHLLNNIIYFPVSPDLMLIGLKNSEWGFSNLPQKSRKEAGIIATILTYDQADRYVFGTNLQALENLFRNYKKFGS